MRDFQIAINLLRDGLVDHKCLITHTFVPEEYRSALDTAMSKGSEGVGKVVMVRGEEALPLSRSANPGQGRERA